MAKKKAVRKKAAKKKAGRKKAAKKKATTKTYRKKSTTKAGGGGVGQIKYRCVNGLCTATPKNAHLTPGSTVNLIAVNTDVKITFLHSSPFIPPTNPINIANGNTLPMVVGTSVGIFDYVLACSACHRTSAANPEMIVP